MKRIAISIFVVMILVTMGFTTNNPHMHDNAYELVKCICIDNWAGEVWVEKFTYGEGGRTVSDWHLMATNTTGVGHCLEGTIIVNGREVSVCAFVSADADSRKDAISIYHLPEPFSVKSNTFHSVEGWKCM
jgi:hypothetical protein